MQHHNQGELGEQTLGVSDVSGKRGRPDDHDMGSEDMVKAVSQW
jgi:hypothetical protein